MAIYLFRADLYSKGVSHHHLYLAETERQAVEWESFMVANREGSGVPVRWLFVWGSCRQATQKQDVLCDWLGVHWLSLLVLS